MRPAQGETSRTSSLSALVLEIPVSQANDHRFRRCLTSEVPQDIPCPKHANEIRIRPYFSATDSQRYVVREQDGGDRGT
ncbi:unnamed protein product [Chondrus crispus]|uniref:Uncharacterized protein n=1 Tax=Chondrus crispus TaxID=2769 RepID=R7QJD8_CHOCR|nr:unnamed protein product [Chondrus crispus]CDF37873.1 unnamed protein product [Chondrus crispus]|eukprot:XP_005717744.1 unnamed protein product [Chondrus crispus]